jgi:hypothetical protein
MKTWLSIGRSTRALACSAQTRLREGSSKSTNTYRPNVRFRYFVSGQARTSEKLYPTSIVRSFASKAPLSA